MKIEGKAPPYILVTIDTEEDLPRWRPESVTTVMNIQRLMRLHEILRNHSIRPTYLVDRPVLEDDSACSVVRQLVGEGGCEVGMHLHSWNSPPLLREEISGEGTVLNGIPREIQREKIRNFYNYFLERLNFLPTSFRAGRYGLSAESVEVLAELGFEVDSSVVPLHDFGNYGAPDYRLYENRPFWIKSHSANILEVPITADLVTILPKTLIKAWFRIPEWTHIKGAMHRLNISRMLWLRPTTYTIDEMRQIGLHAMKYPGRPVLNMIFHSSELYPGGSPYNTTESQVSLFLERLLVILEWLVGECGSVGVTLTEFAELAQSSKDLVYPIREVTF